MKKLDSLKNTKTDVRVVQINVRGIKSKIDDLDTLISSLKQPDIIIISETWLKPGEGKLINIDGYTFEGTPQLNKKGGGIGFLIKKGIIYKTRLDLISKQSSNLEKYYVEVKGDHHKVVIG